MTAFRPADILLPRLSAEEMSRWAVVACDQYTSEPLYWEQTAEIAKGAPSTLELILPELYLEAENVEQLISDKPQNLCRAYRKAIIKFLTPDSIII